MSVAFKKQLDENLRDALLALYLAKVAPEDTSRQNPIRDAQDLYEHWLLDVLVSQDVPTTPVACATASLQQYINRILMNLEPGYDAAHLTPERVQKWQTELHQYPIWAAHQQMLYFPAHYLDPGLSADKSEFFQQLENDLSQNRIQPEAVQSAVLAYLTRFEEVANLHILNGYIDGEDYANGTYYFVAKSRSENTYFWRSLNMAQRPLASTQAPSSGTLLKLDQPQPFAWSDWEKADVPIPGQGIEHTIRPVWFNNRLFIVWAECVHQQPAAGGTQQTRQPPLLRMSLCYKKSDGSWSAPRVCLQGYATHEAIHDQSPDTLGSWLATGAVHHRQEPRDSLFLTLCAQLPGIGSASTCLHLQTVHLDQNLSQQPGISFVSEPTETDLAEHVHVRAITETLKDAKRSRIQAKNQFVATNAKQLVHTEFNLPSGTSVTLANFNDYQKRLRPTFTHDRAAKTLTLSFTTQGVTPGIAVDANSPSPTIELDSSPNASPLRLLFRLPPQKLPLTAYVQLDNHSFFLKPESLLSDPQDRTFKLSFDGLDDVLRDHEHTAGFTLKNKDDLHGKWLSTAAVRHLIQLQSNTTYTGRLNNVTIEEPGAGTPFSSRAISFSYREALRIQYVIYRRAETSVALERNQLKLIKNSSLVEQLTGDLTHIWHLTDIEKENQTVFYGVALANTIDPAQTIHSALKAFTLQASGSSQPPLTPHLIDDPTSQVQCLEFSASDIAKSDVGNRPRQALRLNTTLTPELICRAANGFDQLFSQDTQRLSEPAVGNGTPQPMDFHGAYGRYFTELFLYLPWLIAHRLNAEHQYDEAQRWIGHVFDPAHGHSACWRSLLLSADAPADYAAQAPHDPHRIALSHPVHFRKALYFLYLDILINRGDRAYRALDADGLTEAKSWYARTLDLLGPRPGFERVDHWNAVSLNELSATSSPNLRAFERSLPGQLQISASHAKTELPTIDSPYLRLPFSPMLLRRWDLVESRLYNLRHNFDISGKPLHAPLARPPANVSTTLAAHAGTATGIGIGTDVSPGQIPPYRFQAMYNQATAAVDNVIQFGATLLSLIERKEQSQWQELQQQHVWGLAQLAVDLQAQALQVEDKNKEALLIGQSIVEGRLNHYRQLLESDLMPQESSASALYLASGAFEATASAAQVAAGGLMMVPNIIGLSNGGCRWEGPMHSASALAQGSALAARTTAGHLDRMAQFSRRREEWRLACDQAQLELRQIAKQLAHSSEVQTATHLQLRQAQTAQAQARTSYELLGKRYTRTQLYQWLNGQFATLYLQTHDAAFALCRATEACWQYEIADFGTRFFQHAPWSTTRQGLGAGEQLKLALLQMQASYLQRHERELEIRKIVSLRQLKKQDAASTLNKTWEELQADLQKGHCDFELTHSMFENDYKGQNHYLRRIKTISVTLPAVLGPYDNIRAILTQTASQVFMSATGNEPARETRQASQQIALSGGIDDNGLFTLNFNDERYLPFEYTGAISTWRLTFPNPEAQKALLASLTDIIVLVCYTARAGEVR